MAILTGLEITNRTLKSLIVILKQRGKSASHIKKFKHDWSISPPCPLCVFDLDQINKLICKNGSDHTDQYKCKSCLHEFYKQPD